MGLGHGAIKLNLELWQRGFFKDINSVMDMGSQELTLTLKDFKELVLAAGITNYRKEDFALLANWPGRPRCSAKPFYEMLGVKKYSCIDLSAQHGAIALDLNFPLEDTSLYGQYDLVTDHGNNEHVFNVAEAYRTMHRLCKKSGFMVIIQCVYGGNGYFGYDSGFFEGIAAANNYNIMFASYLIGIKSLGNQFHIPLHRELLTSLDWTKIEQIGICYVMQKQSEADFQYQYQGQYLSKVQGHYGYQLQFLPSPSWTYIPVHVPDDMPIKPLLKLLSRKIRRRIKACLKLQ